MANVTGWTTSDTLVGTTGVDSIAGFAGNDSISGSGGADSVYGGNGSDTIDGGAGNDLIYGDRDLAATWGYRVYNRDFTTANGQAFQIESGTLIGSGLASSFDVAGQTLAARGTTGDPNDFGVIYTSTFTATTAGTYTFSTASDDGSTIRLLTSTGTALTWSGQSTGQTGLTFLNNDFHQGITTRQGSVTLAAGQSYTIEIRFWENLGGNALSATVTPPGGTSQNLATSAFIGSPNATNAGNDSLLGGLGDDTIHSEAGDDSVFGGDGNDSVYGGTGNDTLNGDANDDRIFGGDGTDNITGGTGNDTLSGDAGADWLYGGIGTDSLLGGAGNDTLDGGAGFDVIDGGADRDTIVVGGGTEPFGDTVYGGETGDDYDVLNLSSWGWANTNVVYDTGNVENGTVQFLDATGAVIGSMAFFGIEKVVPCFTPGTRISTPKGEVLVEDLRVGDTVYTRDHGAQVLRWVGRRDLSLADLIVSPHLRPVRISKGALGHGLPLRDMKVSPQHRMLIESAQAEFLFGDAEVLVAAKHMLGLAGVDQALTQGVSYIHLLFDCHEIILADGSWTESFQPARAMVDNLGAEQQAELTALFPDLMQSVPVAARHSLRAHEARVLLQG